MVTGDLLTQNDKCLIQSYRLCMVSGHMVQGVVFNWRIASQPGHNSSVDRDVAIVEMQDFFPDVSMGTRQGVKRD